MQIRSVEHYSQYYICRINLRELVPRVLLRKSSFHNDKTKYEALRVVVIKGNTLFVIAFCPFFTHCGLCTLHSANTTLSVSNFTDSYVMLFLMVVSNGVKLKDT